jgi:hypothetical protein
MKTWELLLAFHQNSKAALWMRSHSTPLSEVAKRHRSRVRRLSGTGVAKRRPMADINELAQGLSLENNQGDAQCNDGNPSKAGRVTTNRSWCTASATISTRSCPRDRGKPFRASYLLGLGPNGEDDPAYETNTEQRHALRALLLCQRVYFSTLWAKSGGHSTPDDKLPPGWKNLSLNH